MTDANLDDAKGLAMLADEYRLAADGTWALFRKVRPKTLPRSGLYCISMAIELSCRSMIAASGDKKFSQFKHDLLKMINYLDNNCGYDLLRKVDGDALRTLHEFHVVHAMRYGAGEATLKVWNWDTYRDLLDTFFGQACVASDYEPDP